MSQTGVCLPENVIDQDLPIVTPPGELDAEMFYALQGIMDSVDFTVAIGTTEQLVRFFPDRECVHQSAADEVRVEGANIAFLDRDGRELPPRYQAYLRYCFHAPYPDTPSGEIRLWPSLAH